MRLVDPLLAELEQESAATRRALERVPGDKLAWKPHAKSMSLGQLAMHIATIPANLSAMLSGPGLTDRPNFVLPEPSSAEDILAAHEAGLKAATAALGGWDDGHAGSVWTFTIGDKTVMSAPRIALARILVLNHLYHHRGELQVYLRLLEVPVPSVYGPTADENPFI